MTHLFGHIPDDHTPEKWRPLAALVGRAPAPAPTESPGLVLWADRVEDQPGSSCVGHGIAGAAYAKEGAANTAEGQPDRPRVYPAPLGIYYNARIKGGYPQNDQGCQPRLAFDGIADYGYCAIEDWPSTDDNLLKQPPADAYRLATDQRFLQDYRIVNEGEEACEDVRQGVSKENPCTVAFQVDAAFQNLKGGIWKGPQGRIVGGHYVWIVEYNWEYVTICNSWGRGWGVNGFGKVAWSVIGNGNVTSDRYVITFAPQPMRSAA